MKKLFFLFFLGAPIGFMSCDSSKPAKEKQVAETEVSNSDNAELKKKTIKLIPVRDSPEFSDAILEMRTPEENEKHLPGDVSFSYNVKNYALAAQTLDADIKQCANSDKGQHIHLILNNEPYTAHYEASFEKKLDEGHYVALSFLSRSYHESLKHYGAYNLRQFTVGDAKAKEVDLGAPHLFYSRPKGTYEGKDTERILLDFYLVNTALALDGNKVRVTINKEEFFLAEWMPYFIEGLPMGKSTLKLELIDKEGKLIPGPFNSVERTITLSKPAQ